MREVATCINVAANGERGRFYLSEGITSDRHGGSRHWCALACHTTFGSVGHTWGSMGIPAARFLESINRDYAISKLWGSESRVFCGDKAVAEIRRQILDDRRKANISREDARERFESIPAVIDNET